METNKARLTNDRQRLHINMYFATCPDLMNFSFTRLFFGDSVKVTRIVVLYSNTAFMKVYVAVGKLSAMLVCLNKLSDPALRFVFISRSKNSCYLFQVFLELEASKVEILRSRGLALKSWRFYLHSK